MRSLQEKLSGDPLKRYVLERNRGFSCLCFRRLGVHVGCFRFFSSDPVAALCDGLVRACHGKGDHLWPLV